jgi:hypothetical protein
MNGLRKTASFLAAPASICLFHASAIACNITLASGADIQVALNNPNNATVCLAPGDYYPTSTIFVQGGKSLVGSGGMDDARIISNANVIVQLGTGGTVGQVSIIGGGALSYWGVLVSQAHMRPFTAYEFNTP